jgi:hypothetical protein
LLEDGVSQVSVTIIANITIIVNLGIVGIVAARYEALQQIEAECMRGLGRRHRCLCFLSTLSDEPGGALTEAMAVAAEDCYCTSRAGTAIIA